MLPFTKSEYLERMRKAQASMNAKGIDVLLITDPANMAYLAGYNAWSFYVHQALIVTLKMRCRCLSGVTWMPSAGRSRQPGWMPIMSGLTVTIMSRTVKNTPWIMWPES